MVSQDGAALLPPLGLYVHVPWCVRKCPYCDFNSHAQRGDLPEDDYLAALLQDLEAEAREAGGRPLSSIFIGGGTPSLMSAEFYRRLLDGIEERFPGVRDQEITLEANPGTFEQARFEAYRAVGINRLSLGIQSFADDSLRRLGRVHSGAEALQAVQAAQRIGFERLNLDLMHGLPQQTPAMALGDLEQALALDPGHLSWYQLTLEPNTEFYSRPPNLPEDEALWTIQDRGQALLAERGYAQYEVSAYSRGGDERCRHNLNYWRFGDYLGIGAGAHGKLTDIRTGSIRRRWKPRQPKAYMGGLQPVGEQVLSRDELPLEFMMNALRLSEGVEADLYPRRTGSPLADLKPGLDRARALGLLENRPDRLQPSERGRRFLNDLLELFLA
ncbi:radical SAM family heme chaperone HemW [Motiliproteus sp. SC1-56]|uniref:radical SAM family heme chaperone HemW n=1 Tax=Motiliproteus sp. SC1-56 TaxID=2799565 RepID=UPI001A8CF64E|nr:radical SAM family heme chaperone HemW [Motiliproteus sp. SC1-56]